VAGEDEVVVRLDADGLHAVGDHARVLLDPGPADLGVRPRGEPPVADVLVVHPLRLRRVDPDRLDAVLSV